MTVFLSRFAVGVCVAWVALAVLFLLRPRVDSARPKSARRALLLTLGLSASTLLLPFMPWPPSSTPSFRPLPSVGRVDSTVPVSLASEPPVSSRALPRAGGIVLLLCVARSLARILRTASRRASLRRRPADAGLQRLADGIARELGVARTAVFTFDAQHPPFTLGLFGPKIYVPSTLLRSLDERSLRVVIRHELLHVAHGDPLHALLTELFSAPFALHPLLPALLRDLALSREHAVDQVASVPDPHLYGSVLLQVAGWNNAEALSMANGALDSRVRRLTRAFEARPSWPRLLATLSASAVVVAAAAWVLPNLALAQAVTEPVSEPRVALRVGDEVTLDVGPASRLHVPDRSVVEVTPAGDHYKLRVRGVGPGHFDLILDKADGTETRYGIDVSEQTGAKPPKAPAPATHP